jgi:arylsulfatase A-like enzyme
MPALDRLVDQGTHYVSAFANGTNTGVSLPSLLTSQYQGTAASIRGPTVASALQRSGISTGAFHSNTLFANIVGRAHGFDDFQDFGVIEEDSNSDHHPLSHRIYNKTKSKVKPLFEYLGIKTVSKRIQDIIVPQEVLHSMTYYINAEELTDQVTEWIRRHSDESFFLWVHYLDPHRPYGIDLENPTYCEPTEIKEIRHLMSKAGNNPAAVTEREREQIIDLYDSDLRYTSREIDRLFNQLDKIGIWENTSIIFTADHGEEFGEHGEFFHRNIPYDQLIHVPLLVKAPEYDREVTTETRELLDIAPTICEITGTEMPSSFQGLPLNQPGKRQVIARGAFAETGPVVAGRWDGWKYIFSDGAEELYNLSVDSLEQNNVVADHPDITASYRSEIPDSLFEAVSASKNQTDSKIVEERLRGLGYMD